MVGAMTGGGSRVNEAEKALSRAIKLSGLDEWDQHLQY